MGARTAGFAASFSTGRRSEATSSWRVSSGAVFLLKDKIWGKTVKIVKDAQHSCSAPSDLPQGRYRQCAHAQCVAATIPESTVESNAVS